MPKADLIISNPPYIPETPEMKKERKWVNPYQGTDLIENIMKYWKKFGKELWLQVSSVCHEEMITFDSKYEDKIIAEMNVPARFTFMDPNHRRYLIEIDALDINNPNEFIEKSTDSGKWPRQDIYILKYENNLGIKCL